MSNFLNKEIKRMNFLFGYKKGLVISEQNLQKPLELVNKFAKDVTLQKIEKLKSLQNNADDDIKAGYDPYIKYYSDLSQGIQATPPNKEFTDKFDKYFSQPKTPELPKTEEADLGNAPEEIIKALKEKEDKRVIGFATSSDPNIAKKNATNQAINKLYEKLGSQQEHQIVKDMRVGDTTYVVVGEL